MSGSINPSSACDPSVVFWGAPAASDEDELDFPFATLHTMPFTKASSAPMKFPDVSRLWQLVNCEFCAWAKAGISISAPAAIQTYFMNENPLRIASGLALLLSTDRRDKRYLSLRTACSAFLWNTRSASPRSFLCFCPQAKLFCSALSSVRGQAIILAITHAHFLWNTLWAL